MYFGKNLFHFLGIYENIIYIIIFHLRLVVAQR